MTAVERRGDATPAQARLLFLDVEACSPDVESSPIEIGAAELEMAPRAAEVALRFAGVLRGVFVVSDAPARAGAWPRRLTATLDPAQPRIAAGDFDDGAHATFGPEALDAVHEQRARRGAAPRGSRRPPPRRGAGRGAAGRASPA